MDSDSVEVRINFNQMEFVSECVSMNRVLLMANPFSKLVYLLPVVFMLLLTQFYILLLGMNWVRQNPLNLVDFLLQFSILYILGYAAIVFQRHKMPKIQAEKMYDSIPKYKLVFSGDMIRKVAETGRGGENVCCIEWSDLKKVYETQNSIYIFTKDKFKYIISKLKITDEEGFRLTKMLKEKTKNYNFMLL
jgi:hypothetical protein